MRKRLFSSFLIGFALLLGMSSWAFRMLPQGLISRRTLSPMRAVNFPDGPVPAFRGRPQMMADGTRFPPSSRRDATGPAENRRTAQADPLWDRSGAQFMFPQAGGAAGRSDWRPDYRLIYGDIGR